MRCVHEAQLHEQNSFITLTYNDENLPEWGSLHKPDLQKFFKRLRKQKGKFRYYACGEYGETTQRAHYHVCLFGMDFNDKVPFKKTGDHLLYISPQLQEIWGHGNTSVGTLTFETAAYTARYVMKKQFGDKGGGYVRVDEATGEIRPLVQPFATMSLRPAIASRWMHKFHNDVYGADKDSIHMNGKKLTPPKYYDKIYDKINPDRLEYLKGEREKRRTGKTDQELHARALIAHARTKQKTGI